MQQQLARAYRIGHDVREAPRSGERCAPNRNASPPRRYTYDSFSCAPPGTHRFDLPALQHEARLVALFDEIIEARLAVLGNQAGSCAAALVMGGRNGTMGGCERLSVRRGEPTARTGVRAHQRYRELPGVPALVYARARACRARPPRSSPPSACARGRLHGRVHDPQHAREPERSVHMQLVSGPFRTLEGQLAADTDRNPRLPRGA